jgi:hypothetical protein
VPGDLDAGGFGEVPQAAGGRLRSPIASASSSTTSCAMTGVMDRRGGQEYPDPGRAPVSGMRVRQGGTWQIADGGMRL